MLRRLVLASMMVAACRCTKPDSSAAASTDEIVPVTVVPDCDPHVDGSDEAHKLGIVDAGFRKVKAGGKDAIQIVLSDAPGACAFDPAKAEDHRAVLVTLGGALDRRPPIHYVIGSGDAASEFLFVSRIEGAVGKVVATSGSVDLIALEDGVASVGYAVKSASGESYGCFKAKACP